MIYYKEVEKKRENLKNILNPKLVEEIFSLCNNLNIRHNNDIEEITDGQINLYQKKQIIKTYKNKNEYIKELNKLFVTMLIALLWK